MRKPTLFGLLVALIVAATAMGAGATPPQDVTLRLDGLLDPASLTVTGTWTASGAVPDSGTYTERVRLAGHSILLTKQLHGSQGSIVLVAQAVMDVSGAGIAPFRGGSWSFVCGTGAYKTLHGSGSPAASGDSFGSFVTGQVQIVHTGEAHYDDAAAACEATP